MMWRVVFLIALIWILIGPVVQLYDRLRAKLSPCGVHFNGYKHTTDYRSVTHLSLGGSYGGTDD